ncbi:MAG: hypothetical protein RIQ93_1629, partial [Verrucomicrobiota bacterium]
MPTDASAVPTLPPLFLARHNFLLNHNLVYQRPLLKLDLISRLAFQRASRPLASLAACALLTAFSLAQVAPASAPSGEGKVVLSPFEVKADSDNSYGALNSNSITRFNTELAKLPVSADVMSKTFMEDVAAVSVEAMISTYSGGGGFANFNAASGAAANQPGENNSPAFTTLRGLTASTTRRDGFMSMTTFNSSGSTSGG